jgi:[ribosomal protein S5]-alanine N-acetyltransferase
MKILETERLVLRDFELKDAAALAAMNSDAEVMRYVLHPEPWTIQKARQFLREHDLYERYGFGRWAVTLKENDELIGWCGLKYRQENKHIDLGYRFARAHWGKGFATEAGNACLEYGFNELGLERVVASFIPGNKASLRVLEKLRMKPCGTWNNSGKEFSLMEKLSPYGKKRNSPLLETDRLQLREFHSGDARVLFALNADPEVIKYTGDPPFESLQHTKDFISDYSDEYTLRGYGRWAVVLKETGETLGWCGLRFVPELNETDLGYRFFKRHWGKGYASESGNGCIEYGFKKLHLKKIVGRTMHLNAASIKVLEKCGMKLKCDLEFEKHAGVLYEIMNSR